MGTDISGHIEVRLATWELTTSSYHPGKWVPAIPLGLLYTGRDYDLFACLFGVRNFAGFNAVAPHRGIPDDLSPSVREDIGDPAEIHSATWLTWAEASAIDWSEPAEKVDERIHEYRRAEDGTLTFVGKAGWSRRFETLIGSGRTPGDPAPDHPEGSEWTDGDTVFRVERMLRGDAVPPDGPWQPVWTVMEALAAAHSPDRVRLVVWFDS